MIAQITRSGAQQTHMHLHRDRGCQAGTRHRRPYCNATHGAKGSGPTTGSPAPDRDRGTRRGINLAGGRLVARSIDPTSMNDRGGERAKRRSGRRHRARKGSRAQARSAGAPCFPSLDQLGADATRERTAVDGNQRNRQPRHREILSNADHGKLRTDFGARTALRSAARASASTSRYDKQTVAITVVSSVSRDTLRRGKFTRSNQVRAAESGGTAKDIARSASIGRTATGIERRPARRRGGAAPMRQSHPCAAFVNGLLPAVLVGKGSGVDRVTRAR